jgi:inorganic phosphate transporter, PiT family
MAAVMNLAGAFLGQGVAHTVSDTIVPGGSATHGLVIVMGGCSKPSPGI